MNESLKNQKIIFSIDNEDRYSWRMAFLEAMTVQGVAPYPLLGVYKDRSEFSWTLSYEDFLKVPTHFLEGQETVLAVTKCNKQYATLWCLHNGTVGENSTPLGSMVQVKKAEAEANGDYTHDVHQGLYFIAKHENPDRECKADREARELWDAIDDMIDAACKPQVAWYPQLRAAGTLRAVRDKQKPKWLQQEDEQ